jgi:hypothetical protein
LTRLGLDFASEILRFALPFLLWIFLNVVFHSAARLKRVAMITKVGAYLLISEK